MQQKKCNKQIMLQIRRNDPSLRLHPKHLNLHISLSKTNQCQSCCTLGLKVCKLPFSLLTLRKSWRSGIVLFQRKKQISFMTVQDFRMLHGSKNLEFQLTCKTSTVQLSNFACPGQVLHVHFMKELSHYTLSRQLCYRASS